MTIQLDDNSQAYYKGVAAAHEVQAEVAESLPKDSTNDQRLAHFWLLIGRRSAQFTVQDELDLFLMGATVAAPARRGFLLEFTTAGPSFHSQATEGPDYDEEEDARDCRAAVSRALVRVASDVLGGVDHGDVYDTNSKIGHWSVND